MTLTPGTRIGPHEVIAQIGVGGMGEVYRATDTNLARQVAIKVLPEAIASDADRLARFDREAKTLASLNHPSIATIYGLERSGGVTALVMELVEGPTLADILAGTGPLTLGPGWNSRPSESQEPKAQSRLGIPFDEALPVAKQIAEALEAAHEQGIVHRDLKPANIKASAGLLAGADDHDTGNDDRRRSDSRDGGVHVAGAGAWQARGQAHRHLGVRLCVVRDAHGPACVQWRGCG